MTNQDIPRPSDVFRARREPAPLPSETQMEATQVLAAEQSEMCEREPDIETFRFARGVVKFVHPEKGFGFCVVIDSKTGRRDEVFFHRDNYTPYVLDYGAKPVLPRYPQPSEQSSVPVLKTGETIALGSIDYPSRAGQKRGPRAYGWTTSSRAEQIETQLHERAGKYPVGLYYYPRHAMLSDAEAYLRDAATDELSRFATGGINDCMSDFLFYVEKPGEFPHGQHDRQYNDIYTLHRPPFAAAAVPEVIEGAQGLMAELTSKLARDEDAHRELTTIAQGITDGDLHYRVIGDEFELSVGDSVMTGHVKTFPGSGPISAEVEVSGVQQMTSSGSDGMLVRVSLQKLRSLIIEVRTQHGVDASFTDMTYLERDRMAKSILGNTREALADTKQNIDWLKKLIESCRRADTSTKYGLVRYESENQPADGEGVDALIQSYRDMASVKQNEIAILQRYEEIAQEIVVSDDEVVVGDTHIPIRGGRVSANKAWYSPGDSDGGMYTLAAIAIGENSTSRPASLSGIERGELVKRVDPSERFAVGLVYDALVEYFAATPEITYSTQENVRRVCEATLQGGMSEREQKVSEIEERMSIITELIKSGTHFASMYELEVAFNKRWEERVRRRMGNVASEQRRV